MTAERFVITTTQEGKTYRKIWKAGHPLALGHPFFLRISRTEKGVHVEAKNRDEFSRSFEFHQEVKEKGFDLRLNRSLGAGRAPRMMLVNIRPVSSVRPVFVPSLEITPVDSFVLAGSGAEDATYAFACVQGTVRRSERLTGAYAGKFAGRSVFRLIPDSGGYAIQSYVNGLDLNIRGKTFSLDAKSSFGPISPGDLATTKIDLGAIQWHFRRCLLQKLEPGTVITPNPEAVWFKKIFQALAAWFVVLAIAVGNLPPPAKRIVEQVATAELDTERPREIVPPVPEPPKEVVKLEPPQPEPIRKEIEKPRPVRRAPHSVPAPAPRIVHPAASAVAVRPPAPAPAPAPPVISEAVRKNEAVKAHLGSVLGFMSKVGSNVAIKSTDYNRAGNQASFTNSQEVASLARSSAHGSNFGTKPTQDSNVSTLSSGHVDGSALNGRPGGHGHKVLGRVHAGGRGVGDGSFGFAAASASGPGHFDSSALERIMKRYLDRFQYCYEKALLSNSGLAGNVVMSWTIDLRGRASAIHVTRSQIGNDGMHSCLGREIARIPFPSPSGGSVTVKYPLNFSSSSL